jgi:hypothetical protein
MKKNKLMSLLAIIGMLIGNISNGQTPIGGTTPAKMNTVTRVSTQTPGIPGYTNAPVVLKLSGQVGPFNPSTSKTFIIGDVNQYDASYQKIKITFENGSLYSIGTYYLPTTINGETVIGLANEPWLTNYSGQYGYGTTIKKTGNNQFTIQVTRFECNGCTPPSGYQD